MHRRLCGGERMPRADGPAGGADARCRPRAGLRLHGHRDAVRGLQARLGARFHGRKAPDRGAVTGMHGKTVYLDYDADTLYVEYDNRGKVMDFAGFAADWSGRSEALPSPWKPKHLVLPYGPKLLTRVHPFLPEAEWPARHAVIPRGY